LLRFFTTGFLSAIKAAEKKEFVPVIKHFIFNVLWGEIFERYNGYCSGGGEMICTKVLEHLGK